MSEPPLSRCAEHGLAFDPKLTSGCVLCRRSARPLSATLPASSSPMRFAALAVVMAAVVGLVAFAWHRGGTATSDPPRAARTALDDPPFASLEPPAESIGTEEAPEPLVAAAADPPSLVPAAKAAPDLLPSVEGVLVTRNDSGRTGAFFIPRRSPGASAPLLVALHGQGGEGRSIVGSFRALALERGFAILAPSSNHVAEARSYTWRVGDRPDDFSPDYRHVAACLDELLARTDVTIDRARVLAAGFSGGASSAPYLATNTGPYEAFAVLHGGVFPGGLGGRRVRGWVSTGQADPARPPDHVSGHVSSLQAAGLRVEFRVYPGGHALSRAETTELVDWWLGAPPLPR